MNTTSALGWALLHFLWQGTLIALLARLLLAMLPRRLAPVRYAVATLALAVMPAAVVRSIVRGMEAPVSTSPGSSATGLGPAERVHGAEAPAPLGVEPGPLALSEPSASASLDPGASALVPPAAPSWRQRVDVLLPWIVGAWALGVLVLALRLLSSYSATRRLARSRGEPVPEAVTAMLGRLAARLGVRRAVRVCSSSLTRVPAVAGWFAPVVLLPASALSGLSRSQLEAVLAHELAHVKRHDYLVNLLLSLIETLLFYHPAVWWLGARVREEREHCCDDLAVAACGSAPLYAEALLSMERLRGTPELALAFSGGSLLRRVERLLAPRTRAPELFPRWIAGISAVAIVALLFATSHLAGAAQGRREPGRTDQVATEAGDVLLHPDPSQTLAARNGWAHGEASKHGYDEFWIGHSIAPTPSFAEGILLGRFDHTGGLVLGDGEDQITIMGGILAASNFDELSLPGVPLAPLVRADPAEVGVLYLWSSRSRRPVIRRVHLATASLPVDFEGLPLLWLGRADDRESIQDALANIERAETAETRENLVGILGAHGTSSLVVPELARILSSSTAEDELRTEAADWLARHPVQEALRALDLAARGDRSEELRSEAAEAVSEMRFAPAFDALVALAHELEDPNARREAVEGLGQQTEPAAVSALLDIVNGDPDGNIRREAVETLGDVPDRAGLSMLSAIARSHPDQEVRREAVETYGACATADDAIALLRELAASDPESRVRCEAVETLGELHDERVVDILTALVERSGNVDVQREAVETLGETILGAAVVPALERIARHHPEVDVQREAVETLGDLHDESNEVLDILAALAADHPSEDVRTEAVETLEDHCPPGRAIPLFERLLKAERSSQVREELKKALEDLRESDR